MKQGVASVIKSIELTRLRAAGLRVLGQHQSTQRKAPRGTDNETALTEDIIALAR